MEQEIKALTEELQKTVSDFRGYVEKEISEMKTKGVVSPETTESLEKANRRIDELEAVIKRASVMSKDTAYGDGSVSLTEEQVAYKTAFLNYLRKGNDHGLADLALKAMSVGSDADGGYLVTPDSSGRIVKKVFEASPMRGIASVETISTDALEGLADLDEVSFGWVSETGARSETSTAQLGKWRIPVHEMYAEPKATQKLLDDAVVDVGAWLEGKIAQKFTRAENASFWTGNGVGKPQGLTAYPTAATADSSRPWGTLEHINTTANGDFGSTAATAQDKLIDIVYALKQEYRSGARFACPRAVVAKIRKFKESTTNGYIWQPGLGGQPATILGFPLTEAEDMPALGTGSLSLAFGNFAETYQIVDRIGIRVLRDPYTTKGYVKFYATKRVGGGVVNFESMKFLRFGS